MHRRKFVAATLATSAMALGREAPAQSPGKPGREFYELRRYQLQMGSQTQLVETYFGDALIPALTRMGFGPVGAFRLEYGPETPAYYILLPASSLESLATVQMHLAQDSAFLKLADPFWNAPATAPAFARIESSLLSAFEGWPHLTPPASSATKAKRLFQLRTYESPSDQAHIRKVEMFHNGEFELFQNAGLHPVFFGDMLIGSRMPNLTYMLSSPGMPELEASWAAFGSDPAWKKLSASPRYNYEAIVSNISNLILQPLAASQI
ncbi:MAG: NIPSNAP family protein [Janthinobacterium lividum]